MLFGAVPFYEKEAKFVANKKPRIRDVEEKERSVYKNYIDHIFTITKLFALLPFRWKPGWVFFYVIHSSLLLLLLSFTSIFAFFNMQSSNPQLYDKNFSRLALDKFITVLLSLCACYNIMQSIVNYKTIKHVLDEIEVIDKCLKSYGLNINYSPKWFHFATFVRFCMLSAIWVTTGFDLSFDHGIYLITARLSVVAPLSVIYAMEYQHNSLLDLIVKRYKILSQSAKNYSNSKSVCDLEMLVKIYDSLTSLGIVVNEMFGKQILFVVGSIFVMVTSSANYIVQDVIALVMERGSHSLYRMFVCFSMGGSRLGELWSMISCCEDAVEEAKEFTTSIYQLMIEDESLRICRNKKLSLHVSSQKEPLYTASGFFNLDNTLFHSVIAAATTYLVILIQFAQGENGLQGGPSDRDNNTVS